MPSPEKYNLLKMQKQGTYFSDIKWALSTKTQSIVKLSKASDIKTKILSSTRILSIIDELASKNMEKKATSLEEERKILTKEAQSIVDAMVG